MTSSIFPGSRRAEAPPTPLPSPCVSSSPTWPPSCKPAPEARALGSSTCFDPKAPDWLIGDSARLRQILLNLLNNAIKFTEKGQVDLRISLDGDGDADPAVLCFAVSDTGIGIAKDKQDRLFKRFSQVDESIH